MNRCFPTTSKRNIQSSEPPYTACSDFYREDTDVDSYRHWCERHIPAVRDRQWA